MQRPETSLEKAQRCVREGEARLADQAAIVAQMQNGPFPEIAAIAEDLLRQYNGLLRQAQERASQLEKEERRRSGYN